MEFIQNLDTYILFWIQNNIHSNIMNKFMSFITSLSNLGVLWILLSLFLLCKKKFRIIGILTLFAIILNTILGEGLLKHIAQRPRPFNTLSTLNIIITKPKGFSFPSGHTSTAFAAAFMLSYYFKKYKLPIFILAIFTGLSRIYLLVHYPSDVICGVILGFISFSIIMYLYKRTILHIKYPIKIK
ncbi:phosphatase PAP2 family protein [Clostridium tarantellae]|uniref:Phosphatase PAP2 family protein n=1 Tax=Clostridium tarantellae TaxID=39493 RepID=A0A6I1MJQ5_9CLOT|nr:phosphatase PAP2 family protein [Clostridium tarantellae]MPQ43615.1 phosphatase PAP2 family protein [Clostridium tarantellae]